MKKSIAARNVGALAKSVCESLEQRRLLSGLTGTLIGTSGSYRNHPDVASHAFDGNLTTFFDAPDASGDWVGLNLGTPAVITQIQYAPRATLAYRMVGGIFQGSSTADFSSGVVNLFTDTATPAQGILTAQPITNTTAFQYVRYIGPNNGYCDVAELEFDGTAQTTSTLPFTPNGTAGSWGNQGNVYTKAFDANLNTFFDGANPDGNYVGATFTSEAALTQISYAPRAAFPGRMLGGIFQGSNSSTFSSGVVNLYTITSRPAVGVFTTVPISTTSAFEYVRYTSPAASYGDIAELTFSGTLTGKQPQQPGSPSVTSSSPANGATGVDPSAFISCALNLPNGAGVNPGSMTTSAVYLYRTFDHSIVPTEVNTDAVGSVIVLQPQAPLDANTQYTFVVTSAVKDESGASFTPYTITFTTGAQTAPTNPKIAFAKITLPTAVNQLFSGVTMGPDGNLYANTLTGGIFEFPVNSDGSLGNPIDIGARAGIPDRLITGIAFDPSSTPAKMTMWISSGDPAENNAPDFSGSIGAITITGSTVSRYQDYIVGLPRSNSNHLNNQPVFGPDGALYWSQGSNTSMGAPDSVWGFRIEHLLNAAILRLNIQAVQQYFSSNKGPLNVQTDGLAAGQAPYNPYAAGAPLTVYATGIRNAYDLIWDNNGHLYVPTNGSAAGGNIPATPAGVTPAAPAVNGVGEAEDDYLYDVVQGGYYGHPDPSRGQYIFGGANPTSPAPRTAIQNAYPIGTNPDPNYKGYAYDFGVHYSPDGAIEYTGNAFGGALNGALLVTEYSGGKAIVALRTSGSGQITSAETGIAGFTGFSDPVDVTEDPRTGDLYVVDLGTSSITLLRPISSGATITVRTPTLYFNAPVNGSASPVQSITITNTGSQPLAIPATGMSVIGSDGALFPIANKPLLPTLIAPGASITVGIVFNPLSSALGLHTAQLQISSNDQSNPLITIKLRALATAGLGGASEPSLQAILDLYQIPDHVGTSNPAQSYFTNPPQTPNDEVLMPELEKAGTGAVTVTPLATFDASITPTATFGLYSSGFSDSRAQVFAINSTDAQSVDPTPVGSTGFDPGTSIFSIYAGFDGFVSSATNTARIVYSESVFNTFDPADGHKIRFYPLKNQNGSIVPNAYVFAVDDGGALPSYQFNNLIGIIRNVKVAPGNIVISPQNVAGSDTASAPSPLRYVFSGGSIGSSPSVFHDTTDLRLSNAGSSPLVIGSITTNNSFFSVSTAITYPLSIAPGGSVDLILAYKPVHTGATVLDSGILTISSNDPVHPVLTLQLDGIWKGSAAPTLSQIVSTFGYTNLGNETVSPYWTRADTNLPVNVQQLAAFSAKTTGSSLYWYSHGKTSSLSSILSIPGDDTQSLLPLSNDKTHAASIGSFSAPGTFGFSVDQTEFSDDSLNGKGSASDTGHHVRFFPVYDSGGNLLPNTWLMAMSYKSSASTYSYTDNVYLISNMRPAPPSTPTGAAAAGSVAGITFSWNAVKSPLVKGYFLFRGTSSGGSYSQLANGAFSGTTFFDNTATPGVKYYYTVAAVDIFGGISGYTSSVSATRPKNTVAPAAPARLTAFASNSSIMLTWSPDSESDLAGYNVYRANAASGTYFKLNSSPVTLANFTDTSSPAGVTSYYHVTAVNASGIESAAVSVSAMVSAPLSKAVLADV